MKVCVVCNQPLAGRGKTHPGSCRDQHRAATRAAYRERLFERKVALAMPIARDWHRGRVADRESAIKLGKAARLRIPPRAMNTACYRAMLEARA